MRRQICVIQDEVRSEVRIWRRWEGLGPRIGLDELANITETIETGMKHT